MKKILFTDDDILRIKNDYLIGKMSCEEIGKKYQLSKQPINRILKELGVIREGRSDGKKINLTSDQKTQIKQMYLDDKKNSKEISKKLNISESLVDKILQRSGFRRNKSAAMSVLKTGKKLNQTVRKNMKKAQQKLSKSGNRKQTGGVCKLFIVDGLECQGTYEKFYIEKIIKDGGTLPTKAKPIITPFGVYYPDFAYDNTLVEIKSDYTYDILVGKKISRFSKKKETKQYKKIKWINMNVMTVDILIVDKKHNTIVKKEII
jgi:Mor family transcriptional regulator